MAKPTKLTKSQQQKLKNASKSFQKMEADIRPFVRKRQIIQVSTGGKWRAEATGKEPGRVFSNNGVYSGVYSR